MRNVFTFQPPDQSYLLYTLRKAYCIEGSNAGALLVKLLPGPRKFRIEIVCLIKKRKTANTSSVLFFFGGGGITEQRD